jgi:hypothetical protein
MSACVGQLRRQRYDQHPGRRPELACAFEPNLQVTDAPAVGFACVAHAGVEIGEHVAAVAIEHLQDEGVRARSRDRPGGGVIGARDVETSDHAAHGLRAIERDQQLVDRFELALRRRLAQQAIAEGCARCGRGRAEDLRRVSVDATKVLGPEGRLGWSGSRRRLAYRLQIR